MNIMLFSSVYFWIFLLIILLIYYITPYKNKWVCLLIGSYIFYILCNAKATFILFILTVGIWYIARKIEYEEKEIKKKLLLFTSISVVLILLGMFKYFNFFIENVNYLLFRLGNNSEITHRSLLLPIGISFYSFKAISYVLEVFWQKRKAERSFGKLALYLAFFPQIMAGPIERPDNFFRQINSKKDFFLIDWSEVILQITWGLFEKLIIADRLSILVNTVYDNYQEFPGWQIGLASICFTLQILCDFDGYSNIAIGVSKAFGFETMKNFDLPYFSLSIKEFWRRWHISLSSWFKDYLYIPLGGNRKGNRKKYCNIMIVFLCSGLWHGAGWNFIIWGGLHGIYQISGEITRPLKEKVIAALHISNEVASYKLLQGTVTFILVNFAWIFFKVENVSIACSIIRRMLFNQNLSTVFSKDIFYTMGLDEKDFKIVIFALGIWLLVSLLQKYIKNLLLHFEKQNLVFRWLIYYMLTFSIIIFGIYGADYSMSNFIYVNF